MSKGVKFIRQNGGLARTLAGNDHISGLIVYGEAAVVPTLLLSPDDMDTAGITAASKRFEFAECIITINQEKNIVTTALQGLEGTIKEYISKGDYSITVDAGVNNYKEGDVTGASLEYPEQQIGELIKLLDLDEALAVQSDFLKLFNVKSAVVTTYDLQQETHSNRQSINIKMLSDKPYFIRLKEEQYSVKA